MLHHVLEHLFVVTFSFYFRILSLYPLENIGNIWKILRASNSEENGPTWPKF